MLQENNTETSNNETFLNIITLTEDDGLIKKITQNGDGELPQTGQEIVAHYRGTLSDGTVFDSSYQRNEPFKFVLGSGQVIRGWDLGFATMTRGEKAILVCTHEYAYGEHGSPPNIPPSATLEFEVELIEFYDKKKDKWEMTAQEKIDEATEIKQEANNLFKSHKFSQVMNLYQDGIDYLDDITNEDFSGITNLKLKYNLNLCITAIKLNDMYQAVNYAKEALLLDNNNITALYRKGIAENKLWNLDESLNCFNRILEREPYNNSVIRQIDIVNKRKNKMMRKENKLYTTMFTAIDYELDSKDKVTDSLNFVNHNIDEVNNIDQVNIINEEQNNDCDDNEAINEY